MPGGPLEETSRTSKPLANPLARARPRSGMEMMRVRKRLYLVLHSPFECDCPEHIERFSGNEDAGVLLIQDGVYYAVEHERRFALHKRNLKVYALDACLAARGFGDFRVEGVEVVDAKRAVELVMDEYDGIIRM